MKFYELRSQRLLHCESTVARKFCFFCFYFFSFNLLLLLDWLWRPATMCYRLSLRNAQHQQPYVLKLQLPKRMWPFAWVTPGGFQISKGIRAWIDLYLQMHASTPLKPIMWLPSVVCCCRFFEAFTTHVLFLSSSFTRTFGFKSLLKVFRTTQFLFLFSVFLLKTKQNKKQTLHASTHWSHIGRAFTQIKRFQKIK